MVEITIVDSKTLVRSINIIVYEYEYEFGFWVLTLIANFVEIARMVRSYEMKLE